MTGFAGSTVPQARLLRRVPLAWAIILLVALVSVPLHLGRTPSDVSWLITVAEKVMAGETLYADILETNPPVPALLYLPAVIAGRAVGLSPETALVIIIHFAGLLTLLLTARILGTGTKSNSSKHAQMLVAAAVILFVLPSDAFAQRDYIAAMFALPMVAVLIGHAETGKWAPVGARVIATILAALTVAIKPPVFALPGLFVFIYYLWQTRRLGFALASGLVVAGVLAALISAVSIALFPDYVGNAWPVVRDVYLPLRRHPFGYLLDAGCVVVVACTILMALLRADSKPAPLSIMALTGAGFLTACVLQGKWFAYQIYPAVMYYSLASVALISRRPNAFDTQGLRYRDTVRALWALVLVLMSASMFVGFREHKAEISNQSWAANLDRPSTMSISPDIATTFPLTRQLGGRYVGRTNSQWVAKYARHMLEHDDLSPQRRQTLIEHYHRDLIGLLMRLAQEKPNLILVDVSPAYLWLMEDLKRLSPGFLSAYTLVDEEGRVNVFRRAVDRKTAK